MAAEGGIVSTVDKIQKLFNYKILHISVRVALTLPVA